MINILHNKLYGIKFFCFLFIILLNILNPTLLIAQEKIATVVKVQSNVHAVNREGEKRLLKLYDSIFLNEEIVTDERSSIVIQYLDNSTIILKKKSSIKVTDFILGKAKNLFLGVIDKGSAIIESGKIAKDSNSKMVIKLPSMSLDIRGTRFNIGQKEDGSYDVGLSEDSFGNVGTINVSSAGTVKTLFDPKQVISVNSDQIVERLQTDIEKDDLDEVTQDFIDVKIINEEDIQKTLESQLISGDIIDINNDGQIDLLDVKVIKESIVVTKLETIDFIVENSKDDNINFLSNVLNESDEKNVGQSIDKIFDTKNDLVTAVLTSLSNANNKFITSSDSEENNEIKEKIFTQLLSGSEQTEKKSKNIELMSKIITKSDVKSIENIINIVKISNASEVNSNLSLQILSSVADRQNEEGGKLENEEQVQVNRLIEEAVASAAKNDNAENSALIANVITKSNVETITQVVDNVQTSNANTVNSTFSLQILSSVADSQAKDSISLESEEQVQINRLIEEAVASAGENDNAKNSALIANVITKSNVETITEVVNNVKKNNLKSPNAGLSLQVLNEVEVNTNNESITLESNKQTQINRLLEEALAAAAAEAAAILAAEKAAAQAAAAAAAAVTAAAEAAAAEAAAILAAAEAAAAAAVTAAAEVAAAEEAAEEEAAATLAAEEAAATLAAAEALARANNLIAECNVAKANVLQKKGEIITATTNRNEAKSAEAAALLLYNTAVNAVTSYVSPATEAEIAEFAQLKATRDALKITYDLRVTETEDASIILTNLNTSLVALIITRDTLCAQAAPA